MVLNCFKITIVFLRLCLVQKVTNIINHLLCIRTVYKIDKNLTCYLAVVGPEIKAVLDKEIN